MIKQGQASERSVHTSAVNNVSQAGRSAGLRKDKAAQASAGNKVGQVGHSTALRKDKAGKGYRPQQATR